MYEIVKCDICLLTFRTTAEKNVHILNHFQQHPCSICQQDLIQIGDKWYSEHSEHLIPKTEPNDDNAYPTESIILSDFVGIKSNDDLHENCIQNRSNLVANDEINPMFNAIFETQSQDNTMSLNALESAFASDTVFQPEQIILPEFIEYKPVEIIHDDSNEHVNENFAEETHSNKIQGNHCPICRKFIKCKTSLKYHVNIHKGIKPFECATCGHRFHDKRNLNQHVKKLKHTVKANNPMTTGLCTRSSEEAASNEMFMTETQSSNVVQYENSLEEHTIPHGSDEFGVSSIVKRDNENSEMNCKSNANNGNVNHEFQTSTTNVYSELNQNDVKPNQESQSIKPTRTTGGTCEICHKRIFCGTSFKYHMNIHLGLKPFACDVCGKAFADKRNMNLHKKLHQPTISSIDLNDYIERDECVEIVLTKEQLAKIECPICKLTFNRKHTLKRHIQIHEGKRYQCKFCEKSFHNVHRYRWHRKVHHPDLGVDAPGKCVQEELSIQDFENNLNPSISIDWLCEYCNEDFELEIRLARHIMKEHNEEKPEHSCNICAGKFSQRHDLLMHMRAHPESYQYKCTFDGCEQGFAFKSSLGVHIDKHTRLNKPIERKTQDHFTETTKKQVNSNNDEVFSCDICNKKYSTRIGVLKHIQGVHTNKRLKCTIDGCDKIFKTNVGLFSHIQNTHPDAMKTCTICNKNFCTEDELAKHRLCHTIPKSAWFACNVCGKKFPKKHSLREHLRQHEKDVTCNICGIKCASARKMMQHRERHGKKSTITCRFKNCNQVFEDRREFMRHATTHPDSEKKKCICSYCGKGMSSMSSLRQHINMHTGEKPYKCEQCEKCFGKSSSLYRHLNIHSGKKPYVCPIEGCDKAYRDSIDLKRHKFSAHNIYTKKHICPICAKVFPERKLLTKHTISLHGKIDSPTN